MANKAQEDEDKAMTPGNALADALLSSQECQNLQGQGPQQRHFERQTGQHHKLPQQRQMSPHACCWAGSKAPHSWKQTLLVVCACKRLQKQTQRLLQPPRSCES